MLLEHITEHTSVFPLILIPSHLTHLYISPDYSFRMLSTIGSKHHYLRKCTRVGNSNLGDHASLAV